MARATNLTMCSFCGKSHSEVRKLIAGPGVYICDSCVTLCKGILDKELKEESKKKSGSVRVPKPAEIKAQLEATRRGATAPMTGRRIPKKHRRHAQEYFDRFREGRD